MISARPFRIYSILAPEVGSDSRGITYPASAQGDSRGITHPTSAQDDSRGISYLADAQGDSRGITHPAGPQGDSRGITRPAEIDTASLGFASLIGALKAYQQPPRTQIRFSAALQRQSRHPARASSHNPRNPSHG